MDGATRTLGTGTLGTGTLGTGTPRDGDGAFDDASRRVLEHLDRRVPMGMWSVSRVVDGRQVHLAVTDNQLGVRAGHGPPWAGSLCHAMWEHGAPRIVPDLSAVPAYRGLGQVGSTLVRAYAGLPLLLADGSLFGTVHGVDSTPRPDGLHEHGELLDLLGGLLTTTLRADQLAVSLAHELERSRAAADTDPLTGLLNLRAWDAVVAVEEARHHRLGETASVVVIDLDDLKAVNDSGGHAAGDDRIRQAARVLRATIRSGDHLARIGGDEFVVLCPRTTGEEVEALARRLRAALADEQVPASVGSGTMDAGTGLREAQSRADQRMYEVKRSRRDPA